jgi:GNAT superfamily N-acetyltransferase
VTRAAPVVALEVVGRDGELRERVLALRPRPDQEGYAGVPTRTLVDAEATGALSVAVLEDGEPVGFFVLDVRGVPGGERHRGAVGLRAFFVDARHQQRGIGTAALEALPSLVAVRFPTARAVVLTVNVSNPSALRTYLRTGFHDTGVLYHGGRLGPQRVLLLDLVTPPDRPD